MEPIHVGRLILVFQDVVKGKKTSTAVVKNAVQNYLHFIAVRDIQKGQEFHFGPQFWVNLEIIHRVIAMVGGREKDRVQIDRIDPQIKQVIHAVNDPLNIPAMKTLVGRFGVPGYNGFWVVCRMTVGKPVRKDLIKNAILHPGRYAHG